MQRAMKAIEYWNALAALVREMAWLALLIGCDLASVQLLPRSPQFRQAPSARRRS